jgi:LPS-assembly lipoprotein
MSSPDRRWVLGALLALGACGFEPAHAPGGSAAALQNRVRVAEPRNVDTYLLVQNLEQRLGRAPNPDYDLAYTLAISSQGQAITQTGTIRRYDVAGRLTYRMTIAGEKIQVATGQVINFTSYSASGSTTDTISAERDARRRLMVILADDLVADLIAKAPAG